MMCIPIVITLIIGLVFGRSGTVELPRIKVLLVDNDNGVFANFLRQGMQQEELAEMVDIVVVDKDEGMDLIEKGKASALIEIPQGFTESIVDQKPTELKVIKNPSETFLPVIVEEMVEAMALLIDGSGRVFTEPIQQVQSLLEGNRWPSGDDVQELLDNSRDKLLLVEGYVTDSLVSLKVEDAPAQESEDSGFNIFAFVMPGSLLIGLLFISELMLRDIIREKESGTLARLFSGPVEVGHVVSGKILSAFAITAISCMMLLIIGRVGFGIDLGRPFPLIVHLMATIFMCTGIITLFYGFIRSERAADAILPVVIIVMALLGGSMIPYEQMNEAMQQVGRFSPVFWAVDGFKKIFIEGAGFREVSLHSVILYSLGILTVVPGAAMLRGRFRRGG